MARSFLPRTSTRLPARGKALAKVTLVDENGFTYEYGDLEVPMSVAREVVAQLHLHGEQSAGGADSAGVAGGAGLSSAPESAADTRAARRRRA
jgi:hypothetical protein